MFIKYNISILANCFTNSSIFQRKIGTWSPDKYLVFLTAKSLKKGLLVILSLYELHAVIFTVSIFYVGKNSSPLVVVGQNSIT
jgi:hypothetical protein